jgi:hypothetical protein
MAVTITVAALLLLLALLPSRHACVAHAWVPPATSAASSSLSPSASTSAAAPAVDCAALLAPLVGVGQLSRARVTALRAYRTAAGDRKLFSTACNDAFVELVDAAFAQGGYAYLGQVRVAHSDNATVGRRGGLQLQQLQWRSITAPQAPEHFQPQQCWDPSTDQWTACCGGYLGMSAQPPCDVDALRKPGHGGGPTVGDSVDAVKCCVLAPGRAAYRHLPVLWETVVWLWIPALGDGAGDGGNHALLLRIEQDGFLRPFDMPTVLWPAGFLLSQWVGAQGCQRWAGRRVLELGSGVGAASVVAAHCGAAVTATDLEWRALGLTLVNALSNGVAAAVGAGNESAGFGTVMVLRLDWDDLLQVANVQAQYGPFDEIIGASLQFEKWKDRMWEVLARLAAPAGGPSTRLALAASAGQLAQCDGDGDELTCQHELSGWHGTFTMLLEGRGKGIPLDCAQLVKSSMHAACGRLEPRN